MKARVESSKFLFHIPAHMTVTVAATLSQGGNGLRLLEGYMTFPSILVRAVWTKTALFWCSACVLRAGRRRVAVYVLLLNYYHNLIPEMLAGSSWGLHFGQPTNTN